MPSPSWRLLRPCGERDCRRSAISDERFRLPVPDILALRYPDRWHSSCYGGLLALKIVGTEEEVAHFVSNYGPMTGYLWSLWIEPELAVAASSGPSRR